MYTVKIPQERIGVLVGKKGETKAEIEKMSQVGITIDSASGDVVIDDSKSNDPEMSLKTRDVIRAIGR